MSSIKRKKRRQDDSRVFAAPSAPVRRSLRCATKTPVKTKTDEKGRRSLIKAKPDQFKSIRPLKAPQEQAGVTLRQSVYNKGVLYSVGDIVSVRDAEDGCRYFAQIRGLAVDQYCEKSAALSWLIPTTNTDLDSTVFDPSTFTLGPDEDLLRKLDFMTFVMNAPSDYFKDRTNPYPPIEVSPPFYNSLWIRIKNQVHRPHRSKRKK
ncbi:unnamed protein product [Bemisia tabaci]|uniref:GATA zinc finger domain-containing protein 1 n=1 Tax=Bemisia tabaci TaxID=7038 RepID=A0A9P0AIX2_BEMTA|nr:PREDICTED: GATA zinc finger domain-containing protein 1 [Bemisia tabaci]CAH0394039.1 unnamed protein product [Bemisia tabaci]